MKNVFKISILITVTVMLGGVFCGGLLRWGNGERVLEKKVDADIVEIKAKNSKFDYFLSAPSPQKSFEDKLPLLIILHGRGESGIPYVTAFKKDVAAHRLIVAAPDWEKSFLRGKSRYEDYYALADHIVTTYSADRRNIFILGVSAGSLLTRALVTNDPKRWAGIILVASDPYVGWAKQVDVATFPPILYVHGEQDEQFGYESLAQSIEVLKKNGFDVELVKDAAGGHEYKTEWGQLVLRWIQKKIKK